MYHGRMFQVVPAGNLMCANVVVMSDGGDRLALMYGMDYHFMAELWLKSMLFSRARCDSEFLTYSNKVVR